jgi:hypothetical protein
VSEPTFHAGSKLAWTEQVASDRCVTDFQARVVSAVARRINGAGIAEISQVTIANIIGARGVRGVAKALTALQRVGYLEILSRGAGRGHKSCFRPILKTPNGRSGFRTAETPNGRSQKPRTAVPVLKIPNKNPPERSGKIAAYAALLQAVSQNQTVTKIPHRPNALAGRWQAMKDCVAETYGFDLVHSWLDKLTLEQIDGSALVLTAPTKFIARHIEWNFAEKIIAAWRHTGGDAGVRDVRFLVGHQQASVPTSPANDIAPSASCASLASRALR